MKEFWTRRIPFFLILAVLGAVAWHFHERNSPPIPASGGMPFQNFTPLAGVTYLENDPRWRDERIGGSGEKLGEAGCAICASAMALDVLGFHSTPKELNDKLKAAGGYNARGWLEWKVVGDVTTNKILVDAVAKPTHKDIDAALTNRFPVAVKLFINGNIPHWVLVVGKQGTNYLMRDPLGDGHTLEPLSKYESDLYGVRIFKPM